MEIPGFDPRRPQIRCWVAVYLGKLTLNPFKYPSPPRVLKASKLGAECNIDPTGANYSSKYTEAPGPENGHVNGELVLATINRTSHHLQVDLAFKKTNALQSMRDSSGFGDDPWIEVMETESS